MCVGGGLFYQMNMFQEACRQTERQTDKSPLVSSSSSFLSSPLFCSFFRRSAVLLFSLRDETQDATLCCLSAFNICLPLPHSPCTSISSSADFSLLICPFWLLSLFLSPLCVQYLCVSSTQGIYIFLSFCFFFCDSFPLCHSCSYVLLLSISFSFLFSLFSLGLFSQISA